ncbi:hypothetical protein ACQEV2_03640 [Streptomyces sp. CA-251387]|uniref:hypothetical protein n=1 Tax=Streptomyces sp. CA-251387 TaxID=3240064 RepID=UPI003D8E28DE
MKDVRHPARHRRRGPGRLGSLLLTLLFILGLSGGTALAAPDGAREASPSTVRVPASAMDAVATMPDGVQGVAQVPAGLHVTKSGSSVTDTAS